MRGIDRAVCRAGWLRTAFAALLVAWLLDGTLAARAGTLPADGFPLRVRPTNPLDLLGGRHHPELHWFTFETPHFIWYYHDGLEPVAREAAAIGEQVYEPVTRSFAHRPHRKTEMVLSRQDDIVNGLTMPWDRVYIWVRQNDYAAFLAGSHTWLRSVVAHEFQHVVAFDAMRNWGGLIAYLAGGVPAWYMEGSAEYFTEYWDVPRSDGALRSAVYRDRLGRLDPHDEGFAKAKYLAWQKGDSTLPAIARQRGTLGLFWWSSAFRRVVGTSEREWTDDWRRAMHTYYYGYAAARAPTDSLGPRLDTVPRLVTWAAFAPDSATLAFSGVLDADQGDAGLYARATRKSARLREVQVLSAGDYKARARPVRTFSWSPDGAQLVTSRFHRGPHGTLLFDLYACDARGGHGRWLTHGARVSEPDWSPDGRSIACVQQGDRAADIALLDVATGALRTLTHSGGRDVVSHPSWSPDGAWIACSILRGDDPDPAHQRGADIVAVRVSDGAQWQVTQDVEVDRTPFWSADGQTIYFTSYRGGTANIYRTALPFEELRVRLEAGSPPFARRAVALTADAEGLIALGRVPRSERLLAITLGTERRPHLLTLDAGRIAVAPTSVMHPTVDGWVGRMPDIFPGPGNPDSALAVTPAPYRSLRAVRRESIAFLPYVWGGAALWSYADPLSVHQLQGIGYVDVTNGGRLGGAATYTHPFRQGTWALSADVHNPVSTVRFYDGQLLYDAASGPRLVVELPFGGRGSLQSEHIARASVEAHSRRPHYSGTLDDFELPPPERGREALASLAYQWRSARPRRDDFIHPLQATGLRVQADGADCGVWGDVSYRRVMGEAYAVRPLAGSAATVAVRGKGVSLGGTPLAQDIVGLTTDTPATAPALSLLGWHGQRLASVDRLRGDTRVELGSQLAFGSAELRVPVVAGLPVSAFGVRAGPVTGAWFLDAGRVGSAGVSTGWHATTGFATRWSVLVGAAPAVVAEWGRGTPLDGPQRGAWRDYVQLTYGTPF